MHTVDLPAQHERFKTAQPFPHIVFDGFLDDAFVREVAASFHRYEEAVEVGDSFETEFEHKKVQVTDLDRLPGPIQQVHRHLASQPFLDQLSALTGIPKLLADPKLHGGGIHTTDSGGRLDVHVDFNYVPDLGWWRRLNLLLYLNEGWQDEWGGQLELWDADVTRCELSVSPILNRCLIFETGHYSYHGVRPVTSPDGIARKSISAYYYTSIAPPGFERFHGTVFQKRPDER